GCGKTTTLKVIAGLIPPDSGSVMFDSRDVTQVPAASRNIGMVFQNLALFPNLTVEENIAFPLEARGRDRTTIGSKVEEVVRLVELQGLGKRYPHQLSGGQQQRVAIARAISADAELVLLDEPLASLDPALKGEVSGVIRNVQRELNVTTLYVTHDQTEAVLVSDFLGVMFAGRLDAVGGTRELYESPPTEESARFLGATNVIPCQIQSITEHEVSVSVGEKSLSVTRPRWWNARHGVAKLRFRPDDSYVTDSKEAFLRGRLTNLVFGGTKLVARVSADLGEIDCTGSSSTQFDHLSRMMGKEVGISVDSRKMVLF
ncbi:MAG TPA: ABC transporter ATP-binding protein, partial [Thermoproteota archaeon]|nr:ABC transporter ATP-binding protein [Thermoproteota archaeon]